MKQAALAEMIDRAQRQPGEHAQVTVDATTYYTAEQDIGASAYSPSRRPVR